MRSHGLPLAVMLLVSCNAILGNEDHDLAPPNAGAGGGTDDDSMFGGTSGVAGEPSGSAGMAGEATDPCIGKICDMPLADHCERPTQFRSYDRVGTCAAGACFYLSHQIACTCESDACTTDPCLALKCDTPPPAACTGANGATQTTYASEGTCTGAGSCNYPSTNQSCPFGCADGACKSDPCACPTNKHCDQAGVCSVCTTDSSCGSACAACAGSTPKCIDLGTSSICVHCLVDGNCSVGEKCNTATNSCVPSNDQMALCAKFCADEAVTCTGALEQYPDNPTCLSNCAGYARGTVGASMGNTLDCRIYHLNAAGTVSASTHCPHTSATPTSFCK